MEALQARTEALQAKAEELQANVEELQAEVGVLRAEKYSALRALGQCVVLLYRHVAPTKRRFVVNRVSSAALSTLQEFATMLALFCNAASRNVGAAEQLVDLPPVTVTGQGDNATVHFASVPAM